jgi:hypothetical protein
MDYQKYIRIIGEIKRIDGTITVSHTLGTNVIFMLAYWSEPEVEERIAYIRKIADIRDVIVGNKKYVRHIIEPPVKVPEDVRWVLEREPMGLIEKALDAKDYYKILEGRYCRVKPT